MPESLLSVRNIHKRFGGVHALRGVSLDILPGEIHCLGGENGCGKSTLIKIISGFYSLDEGEILIDGVKQGVMSPKAAIDAGIQVIYQDFSIFPKLTVMENLAFNIELFNKHKWVNKRRMRSIAREALSKINIDMDLDACVEDLPVADKQLIAICRALLNNARLIIMDEPTTALTKKEVKSLFNVIKDLQASGIAILFVSHKLDEVFEISERYTILRNGSNVSTGETKDLTPESFSYYMTGRKFDVAEHLPLDADAPEALRVEGLCLRNGFKDVSFSLRQGEILGITGLLGSGRSELAQALFAYRSYDKGRVYLDGREIHPKNVNDAIRLGIGYVPEDRLTQGLFLSQSIQDNVSVLKWADMAQALDILHDERSGRLVDELIQEFGIVIGHKEDAIQTLSGGNQQKCLLARWLSTELKILILNGPTVGVDIGAKHDIHRIIHRLAREQKVGVIIISDDAQEILSYCDRTLVMLGGRIVHDRPIADLDLETLNRISLGA